jgi:hypothetical protein
LQFGLSLFWSLVSGSALIRQLPASGILSPGFNAAQIDRVAKIQRCGLIPSVIRQIALCDSTAGGRMHRSRLSNFKQIQFRLEPVPPGLLVELPHFSGIERLVGLFDALQICWARVQLPMARRP